MTLAAAGASDSSDTTESESDFVEETPTKTRKDVSDAVGKTVREEKEEKPGETEKKFGVIFMKQYV